MKIIALFVLAPFFVRGGLVSGLAALNADNTGDWSSLVGVSPLGGVAPDNVFDLPITYGQIPVTVVNQVEIDSASTFSIPDGTNVLANLPNGPIQMAFPGVYGVGYYMANQATGPYTAEITAFDNGGNVLENLTVPSTGAPVFIGVLDATRDIFSIQVDTIQAPTDDFFAFGNVHVNAQAGPLTPEPSTWLLAGSAFAVMAWRNKDRVRERLRRPSAARMRRN